MDTAALNFTLALVGLALALTGWEMISVLRTLVDTIRQIGLDINNNNEGGH